MDDVYEASPAPTIPRRAALTRLGAAALAMGVPVATRRPRALLIQQTGDADFERIMRLASVPSLSLAMIDGVRRAGEVSIA